MESKMHRKKLVVGKDDLRRLMKEQKKILKSSKKRIESPFAKYDNLGQLSCTLCKNKVKDEMLWNAHVQGRTHKEVVARVKDEKNRSNQKFVRPPAPPLSSKRKAHETSSSKSKVIKGRGSHVTSSRKLTLKGKTHRAEGTQSSYKNKGILSGNCEEKSSFKTCLGMGDYSSSEDEEEGSSVSSIQAPSNSLPPGFFDAGVAPSQSNDIQDESHGGEARPQLISDKLPEGFFDDPKMDAKVRKVEYRDKMEEEWELFQRTMKTEANVSEQILEEDEDLANAERNIDEIDDQLHRWAKIDELQKKKEELMSQDKEEEKETQQDNSDVEEQEFDEFLDWRTKQAWK